MTDASAPDKQTINFSSFNFTKDDPCYKCKFAVEKKFLHSPFDRHFGCTCEMRIADALRGVYNLLAAKEYGSAEEALRWLNQANAKMRHEGFFRPLETLACPYKEGNR